MIQTSVSESKAIDDKIKTIVINYLQLMIDCAKDDNVRDEFMERPHPFLREVGMSIPDSVEVVLDNKETRWPEIKITADGKQISVEESRLQYSITNMMESGTTLSESEELGKTSEVAVDVNVALSESDAVVRLPFFDAKGDLLTEIKFTDNAEVILSTC